MQCTSLPVSYVHDTCNRLLIASASKFNYCIVRVRRLVLATSKHIGGVMEGAAAVNDGLGRQCVERAAQGIAWEDWVPLEGGAQFAQGLHLLSSQHSPIHSSSQPADCADNSSIDFVQPMKSREGVCICQAHSTAQFIHPVSQQIALTTQVLSLCSP